MRRTRNGLTLLEVLLVVSIIAVLAGVSYPSVASGIDSIRMRTGADSLAAFLNNAMARVERLQQPVEVRFYTGTNRIEQLGVRAGVIEELTLPDGLNLVDYVPGRPDNPGLRTLMLLPGSPFPAASFLIENRRGARRIVRIDPIAGVPEVTAPQP